MDVTDLGALQLKVLEMLWTRGESTAGELCSAWPGRPRPAYTTVLSVLQKLHRRRLASRRKLGRAHTYSPAIEPEAFRRIYLADVRHRVFGGNAAGVVAALVDDRDVSPEELWEIERILARRRRGS